MGARFVTFTLDGSFTKKQVLDYVKKKIKQSTATDEWSNVDKVKLLDSMEDISTEGALHTFWPPALVNTELANKIVKTNCKRYNAACILRFVDTKKDLVSDYDSEKGLQFLKNKSINPEKVATDVKLSDIQIDHVIGKKLTRKWLVGAILTT